MTYNFFFKYWVVKNGLYYFICSFNNTSGSLYKYIPAGLVDFLDDNLSYINLSHIFILNTKSEISGNVLDFNSAFKFNRLAMNKSLESWW